MDGEMEQIRLAALLSRRQLPGRLAEAEDVRAAQLAVGGFEGVGAIALGGDGDFQRLPACLLGPRSGSGPGRRVSI
jgi:hypothetical protein